MFAAFRGSLGAQLANIVALCIATFANTAANRRFTFGLRRVANPARVHFESAAVFVLALALTSGTLAVLRSGGAMHSAAFELAATTLANIAATVLRFTLFRLWVFRPSRHHSSAPALTNEVTR